MAKMISPIPGSAPPPAVTRSRYDWQSHADGEFYLWRDAPEGEPVVDSRRGYHRLKISAREWAARRGGTIKTRQTNNGRQVWIAIHLPDQDAQKRVS